MPHFSPLFIIIIVVVVVVISIPTVRSEFDFSTIRLHSEDAADLCGSGGGGGGPEPASCPVNCFRTDPVCGVDGVTYWCGCADALCAGVKVAKLGFCEVGNGGPGQALLLVHIVWLIVLAFSVLFGLF